MFYCFYFSFLNSGFQQAFHFFIYSGYNIFEVWNTRGNVSANRNIYLTLVNQKSVYHFLSRFILVPPHNHSFLDLLVWEVFGTF